MKSLILIGIGLLALLACSNTQPEPKGVLRLQLVTTAPQVDVHMYRMPDSVKVINGTFQMQYFETGILTFDNVKKGQYLLKLRGTSTLPNMLDTLITYDGNDRLFLLRF